MPGLITPKGGSTQTTTAKQEVPAYVQASQQNLLNQASNILGPQLQQQQYTQAGVNPDQAGAYDLTRALTQNAFQNSGGSAAGDLALGRGFNGFAYLATNGDVAASEQYRSNPLQHYLDYGRAEGRAAPTAAASIAAPSLVNPMTSGATANGQVAQATTRDATSQGYNAANYGAQGYAAQNASAQGYDPTRSAAEQVSAGEIQQFLNPYTQKVVDTTLQQMTRTRDETAAKNNARAAAAGSFGGSRQALQSAQLDRSFGEQVASTTASLMSAGYDKATATALANAGMRQQTGQANQQASNAAAQFGASAQNTASLTNAAAQNTAAQFGANAQNTAGQFNASAQNAAGQFGAQAANSASLANASASNNASQVNAGAQNTRDQFNATQGLSAANAQNSAELQRYGADISRYQAENSNANALAQLQESIKSGDQTRQLQAIQALLGQGNAQQQMVQSNITTPLQYLQLLQQATPTNYGGTNTTTAPNNAPSPLQSLLGAGLTIGSKFI